jgi:hypothetical protein
MRTIKLLTFFILLITCGFVYAGNVDKPLNVTSEDGAVSTYPYKLKVSNGALTDNGDGTTSLAIGGAGLETDPVYTTDAPTRYLKLDQTAPQTINNGAPLFDDGLNSNGRIILGTDIAWGYQPGLFINMPVGGFGGTGNKNAAIFASPASSTIDLFNNANIGLVQQTNTNNNYSFFNFYNANYYDTATFGVKYLNHDIAAPSGNFFIATANGALPTVKLTVENDGDVVLSKYTTDGFVKFTGSTGTLGVDTSTYLDTTTAGTTYLKLDCSNDPLTGSLDVNGNDITKIDEADLKKLKWIPIDNPIPPTAAQVTTNTGNLDDGTYYYSVTYYNADGETSQSTASNLITVDATHKQVTVTIPVSAESVTGRRIYRTKKNPSSTASPFYFLATVANNADLTYTDNIADASLPAGDYRIRGNTTAGRMYWNATSIGKLSNMNIILGYNAGSSLTGGGLNTFIGTNAGQDATFASYNLCTGENAGQHLSTGTHNSFIGSYAGYNTTTGSHNAGIGSFALANNYGGNYSTGYGTSAGRYSTGDYNIYFGYASGYTPNGDIANASTTGTNNVFIGGQTGQATPTPVNKSVAIGNNAIVTGDNQCAIGGTGTDALNVGINNNNPQYDLDVNGDGNFTGRVNAEKVYMDTTPSGYSNTEGQLCYDDTFHTLGVDLLEGSRLQVGQETMCYVYNATGSNITQGQVVYITGANSGIPTVDLADATDVNKSFVLGVVTTAIIEPTTYGYVTIRGHVNTLDTSAWTVGTSLYLSATTPGALTSTAPSAGSYDVRVGRVMIQDASNGRVYINVRPMAQLTDLGDVTITTPSVDQVLGYNGTEWVNRSPSAISAGPGIEFFNCTPVVNSRTSPAGLSADGTSGNGIQINSLSKTPVTTAEQTITGSSSSDTRAYVAWLYDTALGRTTIDAGVWDFTTYAAVNSVLGGRVTTNTRQIYQVVPVSSGTVTTTDLGANTKTATITSGQFAGTYFAASATNTTASYLQTPSGIYQISAIASANSATIIVPTGYSNENAVTFNVWNKLFGSTSGTITSTGTNYAQYDQSVSQPAFTIAATDKLGQMGFVTSNNTTTLTVAYNGTAHSTHFQTPLVTLHNNLAGLQGGAANDYYHLTGATVTDLTDGNETTLHKHGSATITEADPLAIKKDGVAGGQTLYGGTAANDDLTIHGTSDGTRTTSYLLLQPTAGKVGVGTSTINAGVMEIGASGNFGASNAALNIVDNSANATVNFQNVKAGNDGYAAFDFFSSTGSKKLSFALSNASSGYHAGQAWCETRDNVTDFLIGTNTTPRIFIDSLGSIGIGTSNTSAAVTCSVYDATATTGSTQLLVQGGATANDALTNKLFRINKGGGTTEIFSVQGNGNVELGSATSKNRLQLDGSTTNVGLTFDVSNSSSIGHNIYYNSGWKYLYTDPQVSFINLGDGGSPNADISFYQAAAGTADNAITFTTPTMYMKNSNKCVGIGLTAPTSSLHVASTIADGASAVATTIDTTSAWSNAGAKLLSLKNNTSEKAYIDYLGGVQSGAAGQDGEFRLYSEEGATDQLVTIKPNADMTQDTVYTLPPNDGDASYFLQTDGSGNLSWAFAATGTLSHAAQHAVGVADTVYPADPNADKFLMWDDAGSHLEWATPVGSGDITSVGDVATGAAFDGTQGTTLTFYNAGGNATLAYDGTDFDLSKTITTAEDIVVTGSDVTIGVAGVKLTGDGDGALTFLGLGNGYDEDLKYNFDDVENTVGVTSSTGVTKVDYDDTIALEGKSFTSTVATGTAPYAATSTTLNSNLNADLLDGEHITAFSGIGKNKIINGAMDIAQRGTSFAAIASGYSLDRWGYVNSSAAVHTVSQDSDTPTLAESGCKFNYSLKADVTTADASIAATDVCILTQKIEGYNIRDLMGKSITLSFWVKGAKTGIHCVSFRSSGADLSYIAEYTINSANTWEKKTVTLTMSNGSSGTWGYTNGIGVYVDFALNAGANYQTAAGSWTAGNYLASANQVNETDNTANNFWLTGIQLELGSTATNFEVRNIAVEGKLCQRYYETLGLVSNTIQFRGYAVNGEYIMIPIFFRENKRDVPTVTKFGTWTTTAGQPVVDSPSGSSCRMYVTADANEMTGAASVDTTTYIEVKSEL